MFTLEVGDGVLEACRERSATLGKRVKVGEVAGRAVAIRKDGALLLETPSGVKAVLTGDVQMVQVGQSR